MLKQYRRHVTLGPTYAGQPGALSAVVEDTNGVIVTTMPTFVEVGSGTGEYEGVVTLDTALSARYRYTWTGFPARDDIEPDSKVPSGLPANTLYAYPATLSLGSGYSGQADKVRAQVEDAAGTVLTTIAVFVEVGIGTGEYEANPLINSSWDGLVRYSWAGAPEIITIEPDELVSAVEGGTSSSTTLTDTDHAGIIADVVAAVGQRNIWLFPVLAQFLPAAEPVAPHVLMPALVPGTDRTLLFAKGDLPEGTRLLSATLGLRVGSSMIGGLADLVVTPTLSEEGQITNPGVETGKGTTAVSVLFILPNAKTAFVAPGSVLRYFVTASDASSPAKVYELEQGSWAALTDGPRG